MTLSADVATDSADAAVHLQAAISTANARYALKTELVRGGMGRILRADDRILQREVALKCLREDQRDLPRFAQEIAILSRLSHPAIVAIFDAGWLAPEFPYFAMPLLHGETLDQHLQQPRDATYRLALMRRLMPIINAVAYAHSEGILHRDIKPQNIFLGPFDECILLDWGLATETHRAALAKPVPAARSPRPPRFAVGSAGGLTRAGVGMGTVGYSAPEQLAALPTDERADVYALGAMLYFVLTGGAPDASALVHVCALAPAVPAALGSVIMRALAPRPADRYATANELANELERYYAGLLVVGHRYSAKEIVWRWLRAHRAKVAVVAVTVLAVVASSAIAWQQISRERDRAVAQRALAIEARRKTQALSTFVLVDVQAKFDQLGRLDLLTDLANAATTYLADADPNGATFSIEDRRDNFINHARIEQLLGDVAQFSGAHATALGHYEQGLRLYQRAAMYGATTFVERCRSQLRIGDAELSRGNYAAALTSYQACATLARLGLATPQPDVATADLVDVAAQALAAAADITRDQNQFSQAIAQYQQALTMLSSTSASTDAMARRRSLLLQIAIGLRVGNAYKSQQLFAQAQTFIEQGIRDSRVVLTTWPRDIEGQDALINALLAAAQLQSETGQVDAMAPLLDEALPIAEQLADNDPANVAFANRLGAIWQLQAEYADPATQGVLLQKTIDLSRARLTRTPDSLNAMHGFISDGIGLVDWLSEAKRNDEAAVLCSEVTTTARKRRTMLPANTGETELLITLLHCADVDDAMRRRDAAQAKRAEAVALSREANTQRPDPETRRWLMQSLVCWLDVMPPATAAAHLADFAAAIAAVAADPPSDIIAAEVADARTLLARLRKQQP